jgi:hypothetical protein
VRIHKSSLIGPGLTNVRYVPVATKFRIAAKRRDGPGAALSGCST